MLSAVEIGKRIQTKRKNLDISRETFCKDVDITSSALSMYESGHRVPRDEVKIRIAKRLGMSIEALFFAK